MSFRVSLRVGIDREFSQATLALFAGTSTSSSPLEITNFPEFSSFSESDSMVTGESDFMDGDVEIEQSEMGVGGPELDESEMWETGLF